MNKAVIFDLDGTILDTLKDIADNVNLMLTHFGYPTLEHKEIMQYIGNGARLPAPSVIYEQFCIDAEHPVKQILILNRHPGNIAHSVHPG